VAGNITTLQAGKPTMKSQGGGRQQPHYTGRQTNDVKPRRWQATSLHYKQANQPCKTKEVAGNITTLQAGKPTMKSQGGGRQQPHTTGRQTNHVKPRRWQATLPHYKQANQPCKTKEVVGNIITLQAGTHQPC
jgi:hypothetical protein